MTLLLEKNIFDSPCKLIMGNRSDSFESRFERHYFPRDIFSQVDAYQERKSEEIESDVTIRQNQMK